MTRFGLILRTLILVCLLSLTTTLQVSAAEAEPAWKFNRSLNAWSRVLDTIGDGFENRELTVTNAKEIRQKLAGIREEATEESANATTIANESDDLLAALGPRPKEGEPEEDASVVAKRQEYEERIADYRGRVARTQLIIVRVDTLSTRLTVLEQGEALQTLTTRTKSPLSLEALAAGASGAGAYLARLATIPSDWWRELTEEEQARLIEIGFVLPVLALLILAFAVRWVLMRQLGRDRSIDEPSYTRRLIGASTEALANGLVPSLLAIAFWVIANRDSSLIDGAFLNLVDGLVAATLIIIAAIALPRAALAPRRPKWRVSPIHVDHAVSISQRIGALGILFAVDTLVHLTAAEADAAFLALFGLFVTTAEGLILLDLLRLKFWTPDADWQATQTGRPQKSGDALSERHTLFWKGARYAAAAIAIAAPLAALTGYAALASYLIGNLLLSGLTVGALFLLRALLTEWIDILMAREAVARWLNLSESGAGTVRFWLLGFLEVVIYAAGALLVGAAWGLPLGDLWVYAQNILTGIRVGGVTISIADIGEALVLLVVTLLLFQLGKRLLRETILPQTRLDAGAQYSIATVFGYIGIVIAFVLAASAVGADFQNLLIIAGALSVGIGFGLQNIANNFISGLVLLFERPIRVGDLIEIGGTIGHVTHINVRRTEVETFQRAEVMIPNSELIASSVTNWTHSDLKARIEVNVGVAYGSDTALVQETLLKAAQNTDKIIPWPRSDVLFLNFGDSSLDFQLRCFTDDVSSRVTTASALRFEIDRLFREAGITIPFPQRVLHMAKDTETP